MSNEVESPASDSVSPETQQILAQLRSEGNEIAGDEVQAPPETAQEAPQSKEAPKPEEVPLQDTKAKTDEPLDRSPKEPVLIPAWEHKIAEKRWEREREALNAELEALRQNPTPANQQAVAQTASNLKELAQHYGLELDDAQEKFFGAILDKAVPKGLNEKLEALERERNIAFLESQYDAEFRKDVVPMLVERYGVDEQQLAELKARLHDLAFTETYAKVPLKKVFLAEESEFKLSPNEPRSTVKAVKSGKTRGTSIDFDSVDEDTFARMSPEDIERYAEHQISKSGGRKWR